MTVFRAKIKALWLFEKFDPVAFAVTLRPHNYNDNNIILTPVWALETSTRIFQWNTQYEAITIYIITPYITKVCQWKRWTSMPTFLNKNKVHISSWLALMWELSLSRTNIQTHYMSLEQVITKGFNHTDHTSCWCITLLIIVIKHPLHTVEAHNCNIISTLRSISL